ncbi:hypothetical protein ACA910_008197 [Epithemia clementina (nom. ined.)]
MAARSNEAILSMEKGESKNAGTGAIHSYHILPRELYASCDRETESALIRDLKACCWEQQGFELSTQERTGQTARRSLTLRLRLRCANHTKKRGSCPFRFTVFWNVSQQFWYFCPPVTDEEVSRFCHAPTCVPYWLSNTTTTPNSLPSPTNAVPSISSMANFAYHGNAGDINSKKKQGSRQKKNVPSMTETNSLVHLLAETTNMDQGSSFSFALGDGKSQFSPSDAAAFSLIAAKQSSLLVAAAAAGGGPQERKEQHYISASSNPVRQEKRTEAPSKFRRITLSSSARATSQKRSSREDRMLPPGSPPYRARKHKVDQEAHAHPSWLQTSHKRNVSLCPFWENNERQPTVSLQEAAQAVLFSLGGEECDEGMEEDYAEDYTYDDSNHRAIERSGARQVETGRMRTTTHQGTDGSLSPSSSWINLFLAASSSSGPEEGRQDSRNNHHSSDSSSSASIEEIDDAGDSPASTFPVAAPVVSSSGAIRVDQNEITWDWNFPAYSAPSA